MHFLCERRWHNTIAWHKDKLCVRKTTRGKVQISFDASSGVDAKSGRRMRRQAVKWEERVQIGKTGRMERSHICVIFVFSGKGVNGATSSSASGIRDTFPFVHGQCSPLHYPQNSKRKDQKNARIRILTHRLSALSLSILLTTRVSWVCANEYGKGYQWTDDSQTVAASWWDDGRTVKELNPLST